MSKILTLADLHAEQCLTAGLLLDEGHWRKELQAEVERMEAEREQLSKERQGFKDVAEHLQRERDALKAEIAALRENVEILEGQMEDQGPYINKLRDQNKALREDAERLDWIEQKFFLHKWNGVVGSGCQTAWGIVGDYRHVQQHMRNGDIKPDFRAAIDAAKGKQ